MSNKVGLSIVDEGDIRILRISRPEFMNALNRDLLTHISAEIDAVSKESRLRALVITGEGDRAFCGGADLKERRDMSQEQTIEFVRAIGSTFRKIEALEIPTIAAMNGFAFGGGLELALACDFRIAVADASLGLTECKLGIIPGAGGTQRLPRLIGLARAKKMILTAEVVDANRACKMGLIDEVVMDAGKLLKRVRVFVEGISQCAPLSVKAAKQAICLGFDQDIDAGLAIEFQAYESILGSNDRREGLEAFAQKRAPDYKGN